MSTDPIQSEPAKGGPVARLRRGIRWLNANKKRFFWWWVGYQAIKGIKHPAENQKKYSRKCQPETELFHLESRKRSDVEA